MASYECCLRLTFLLTLTLNLVVGIVLVLGGVCVLLHDQSFSHLATEMKAFNVAVLAIAFGATLFVFALIGWVSYLRTSLRLLQLFLSCACLALLGHITVFILGIIGMRMHLKPTAEKALTDDLKAFNESSPVNEMTSIQSKFHCCGVFNYSDWLTTTYYERHHYLPPSCCAIPLNATSPSRCLLTYSNSTQFNFNGCLHKVTSHFRTKAIPMLGVIFGSFISHFICLISSILVLRLYKEVPYMRLTPFCKRETL